MARTLDEILAPKFKPEPAIAGPTLPFVPKQPEELTATGLNEILLEDLICKFLLSHGLLSGRDLARKLCLPLKIFEDLLYGMKQGLLLTYHGTAGVNDFVYALTEKGREKGLLARNFSGYLGAVPVLYEEYVASVARQSLHNERPTREAIQQALAGLVLPERLLAHLGPALHSGRGLFLYGEAGNGKSEVARRIGDCFHDTLFLPRTLLINGHLVNLYDPQCHAAVEEGDWESVGYDRRWVRIRRPHVVAAGEMDLASLEIGYNDRTKVCEASLQMKSNNGLFVIDDLGRQRVTAEQLLNRWILPLEKQVDYLTLPDGVKFRVPFNTMIVFCTNLDPTGLLDEAFLRRIPYKVRMLDPTETEFLEILENAAAELGIAYDREMAEYLLASHFRGVRPLRGCHPRDLLRQLLDISGFENTIPEMRKDLMDRAVSLYF